MDFWAIFTRNTLVIQQKMTVVKKKKIKLVLKIQIDTTLLPCVKYTAHPNSSPASLAARLLPGLPGQATLISDRRHMRPGHNFWLVCQARLTTLTLACLAPASAAFLPGLFHKTSKKSLHRLTGLRKDVFMFYETEPWSARPVPGWPPWLQSGGGTTPINMKKISCAKNFRVCIAPTLYQWTLTGIHGIPLWSHNKITMTQLRLSLRLSMSFFCCFFFRLQLRTGTLV